MSEQHAADYALRDAVYDAFMAFWRSEATDQPALWAAYCAAQARYAACPMHAHERATSRTVLRDG